MISEMCLRVVEEYWQESKKLCSVEADAKLLAYEMEAAANRGEAPTDEQCADYRRIQAELAARVAKRDVVTHRLANLKRAEDVAIDRATYARGETREGLPTWLRELVEAIPEGL